MKIGACDELFRLAAETEPVIGEAAAVRALFQPKPVNALALLGDLYAFTSSGLQFGSSR